MSDVDRAVAAKITAVAKGVVTQAELARYMGLSRPTLSQKLSGARGITLDNLYGFAEALGVHPFDLLPEPEELENDG